MRMNKLSIDNLKVCDSAKILPLDDAPGFYVVVSKGNRAHMLRGNEFGSFVFDSVEKAMRTIRRYRKDISVTSI